MLVEKTPLQEQNIEVRSTMNTTTEMPNRPGTEVDPEVLQTVRERMATLDEDRKTAVDAREAIAEIRRSLKTPVPR